VDSERRRERIARNESSFREINERLESGLRLIRHQQELHSFICECGDQDCSELISLTFDEYRTIRKDSRHFAVVPGHVFPDAERVIVQHERYEMIEKLGQAVEIVDALDERAPDGKGRRSGEPPE